LYLSYLKEKLNQAFPGLSVHITETPANPFRFSYPK